MNEKLKSYLTADTLVPLSLMLTIMGGVFWLSVMWVEGKTNAKEIVSIKVELRDMQEKSSELENRFTRLESALERLEESISRIDKRTEVLDNISRLQFN